jgi:ABC-type uncharacterized transport system substrate-binding protein
MKRRAFITLIGGAATWPLAARAQQPAMPVVGYLSSRSPEESAEVIAAFRQGLRDGGFVESHNLKMELRWAEGEYARLTPFAAELVDRGVAVIVAIGPPAGTAAKAATATIPIIFQTAGDPVEEALVASLSHPGGNMTGVTLFAATLNPKRLQLLRELVPQAGLIALLLNPNGPNAELQLRELEAAARSVGQQLRILNASSGRELEVAFAQLAEQRPGGLLVAADPFFISRRDQIAALAARHAMPTIYNNRQYAEVGGLISYGTRVTDSHQQVGLYVARILKGAKPSDLPVLQPTKFELVINLKTAKALGLDIPPTLLARADEVIE